MTDPKHAMSLRLPAPHREKLQNIATWQGTSMAAVICRLIAEAPDPKVIKD